MRTMTKLFMYGMRLQKLEQMMMLYGSGGATEKEVSNY